MRKKENHYYQVLVNNKLTPAQEHNKLPKGKISVEVINSKGKAAFDTRNSESFAAQKEIFNNLQEEIDRIKDHRRKQRCIYLIMF